MPTKEEREAKKVIFWKKFWWYIEEVVVLLFSVASVIFSDAILKRAKGEMPIKGDIALDWMNIIISSLIAIIVYSSMNIDWRWDEESKRPALIKRIANSILQGIAWRTLMGITN